MPLATIWSFQGKNPTKFPTDNMKSRDYMINEKIENLKNSKNYNEKKFTN